MNATGINNGALTFADAVREALARGFTHVVTRAGPRPLATFRPWGLDPETIGAEWLAPDMIGDHIAEDADARHPSPIGIFIGRWRLVRQAPPCCCDDCIGLMGPDHE